MHGSPRCSVTHARRDVSATSLQLFRHWAGVKIQTGCFKAVKSLIIGPKFWTTSRVRACHKLLEISQKVAFSKESCSIFFSFCFSAFIWSAAKICNLYNKSNISKHFCAILRCNQRRWINLFKNKCFLEYLVLPRLLRLPSKNLNDLRHLEHSLNHGWPNSLAACIFRPWSAPEGTNCSFFTEN